jgi:hypothetical protein
VGTAALGCPASAARLFRCQMKFAKIVFRIAAIWGILILTPLYFIFD